MGRYELAEKMSYSKLGNYYDSQERRGSGFTIDLPYEHGQGQN